MDIDKCIEQVKGGDILSEHDLLELCFTVKAIMALESNVLEIKTPVTVCGDIHGQFYDLLRLFEIGGNIPDVQYLFMGDYVDRGIYSIETITFLLLHKVKYPDRIHLLRGNHETRMITQDYGFYDECIQKYGNPAAWTIFMDVFDYFNVAAVIDNSIYCVHGGLSPTLRTIDQIRYCIDRNEEVPHEGSFCDLMWSDPEENEKGMRVSSRGAGYLFGKKPVDEFCQINNIQLIARAHQLVMEGYKYQFENKLVTVWSAPNYCSRCGNIASIMKVNENLERNFTLFDAVSDEEKPIPKRVVASMFN
ncbi:serine/threonine protein phosphatase ppe1, putative [Entamoeba dispar SAW760]|uniref:Serine/threonine-protein phosphatase n=1 Tax=Entamoeba dispar (strain ATCC PRA-260 / SAW760) TaxID=370354 RepID=B0ELZ5_ENTDS|nr:serine/threonine protein phosphatase ppe1, putative [Entamoeba dispar SAW760]EDR24451.1 serine/threonine protein phosphatase ppe1, putative [Entamoeba dispar SAW760]|eukprot:EDR24451.1 serine/threonine protein phosphatase ppe1, putative [Entamoeba dispar SAW760]